MHAGVGPRPHIHIYIHTYQAVHVCLEVAPTNILSVEYKILPHNNISAGTTLGIYTLHPFCTPSPLSSCTSLPSATILHSIGPHTYIHTCMPTQHWPPRLPSCTILHSIGPRRLHGATSLHWALSPQCPQASKAACSMQHMLGHRGSVPASVTCIYASVTSGLGACICDMYLYICDIGARCLHR